MKVQTYTVNIRFYEELNDFLPHEKRRMEYEIENNDRRSVKDLIESQGIPHTEVDLILVNGESAEFCYQVSDGDRISVYPCFELLDITSVSRLGRAPLRRPRFLVDVNLGKLSRNLRLLGLDSLYDCHFEDSEIIRISRKSHRIILTRDRELLMHKAVTHGLFIHATDPTDQVREVVRRIDLRRHIRPFTRCPVCNGMLDLVDKRSVHGRVPVETYRGIDSFYECGACSKPYWRGAHWNRLKYIVTEFMEPASPP